MNAFISHSISAGGVNSISFLTTNRRAEALHAASSSFDLIKDKIDFNGAFQVDQQFFLASKEVQTLQVSEVKTFEAVAPDATILIGFGLVFVLSIIASLVWANEVVPVSRTKLALSKRDGEVKEYLDGLKVTALQNIDGDVDGEASKNIEISKPNVGDGRDFERWLFSDWLNNNSSAGGGRKKEAAIPILKKAKWNSGDNPVLVTVAIMMVGIVIASITERL